MSTPKHRISLPLYVQILLGMVAGAVVGLVAASAGYQWVVNDWVRPWGGVFIRLLQLVAIPLVFVSLFKGVCGLKQVGRLSRLGGRTVLIYLATTLVAVLLGLLFGLVVKPGRFVGQDDALRQEVEYGRIAEKTALDARTVQDQGPLSFLDQIVPGNLVAAASDNSKMLQVIFFALFFGIAALSVAPTTRQPVLRLFDGLYAIILRMVDFIVRLAPWGVAALMAGLVADFYGKAEIFAALGAYALTVAGAMLLLLAGFYPLLIRLFTDIGPRRFLRALYPVQLFAFTTSSSSATLPVTMETVERDLEVSPEVSSFVLPVGATINMDGTSCYQTVAVLFIAQVFGIDLSLGQLLAIVGMTVISSIGTPGIPGGSYVILTMVLATVGIPAEGLALILCVDRPLDMLRTAVNVTGDAAVASIVDRTAKSQQTDFQQ